jgi:hypothetical protein
MLFSALHRQDLFSVSIRADDDHGGVGGGLPVKVMRLCMLYVEVENKIDVAQQ